MVVKTKRATKHNAAQENIVNDAPKLHETFEPGDVAHQGDLIIVSLKQLPRSAKPRKNRQLAEGTTQGSRHVLARGELYDCDAAEVAQAIKQVAKRDVETAYIGPVFVAPADATANDLTHPEHGDQGFPAGSVCAVVYQRALDEEERAQRVAD